MTRVLDSKNVYTQQKKFVNTTLSSNNSMNIQYRTWKINVQPCMQVCVLILSSEDRGHYVFDTHLFSMFCIKNLLNY